MPAGSKPNAPPTEFTEAVAAMRLARLRPEVVWDEAPAPQRVAPYAVAFTADVTVDEVDVATGRMVLLHDPAGHESWQGTFRCVVYVRADSEPEIVNDVLLGGVAWTWLTEALTQHEAEHVAPSGTVTRVTTESFGGMADDPVRAELELRASWTPVGVELDRHVAAWGDLLCTAAGLPPASSGVVNIPKRRVRS